MFVIASCRAAPMAKPESDPLVSVLAETSTFLVGVGVAGTPEVAVVAGWAAGAGGTDGVLVGT